MGKNNDYYWMLEEKIIEGIFCGPLRVNFAHPSFFIGARGHKLEWTVIWEEERILG
jgi:hypothetical protein